MPSPKDERLPVIRFNPVDANAAYAVHTTLLLAEIAKPELADNPHWQEQRDIAFARFRAAFEVTS